VFDFFNQGWFGNCLGLIGLGVAWWSYSRSIKKPTVKYFCWAFHMIGVTSDKSIDEHVVVNYKGRVVPRLGVSFVVIWNSGNATLDKSSIPLNGGLHLKTEGVGEIIEYSILKATESANDVVLCEKSGRNDCVELDFDYLDPQDGVLIRVLHTDPFSRLNVSGVLKGVSVKNSSPKQFINIGNRTAGNVMGPIFFAMGIMLLSSALIPAEYGAMFRDYIRSFGVGPSMPLGVRVFVFIGGVSQIFFWWQWFEGRRMPTIPEALRPDF
jgi:hypothetical protein